MRRLCEDWRDILRRWCKDQVCAVPCADARAGAQVMCKPGTVKPHKTFEAEIYALNKEEGGRHKPFFSNYKPQFYFRTADITGAACFS